MSSGTPSGLSQESSSTVKSSLRKTLVEKDGEIGYTKSSNTFVAMTNFAIKCTGYVTTDIDSTNAEGYLLDVYPKNSVPSSESEQSDATSTADASESYYLTWKDMSSQTGILNVMSSKKLWTAPSKEQYLPTYLKSLCDDYSASPDAHRMLPVKGLGFQKASGTPTWIFASNFQVELKEGRARRIPSSDSPFCVIASDETLLPVSEIEGNLDAGECLKELISTERELMGANFLPSLLVLGGLGIAVHFEQLSEEFNGVPFIMAYGAPVSGKSSAVEAAMAIIGQIEKVGECTLAGALRKVGNQSLPFWWDDVNDFSVLEQFVVAGFNKANKVSAKTKAGSNSALTVPIMTMNPTTLTKYIRNNKEKMLRTFSRTAVIPFSELKRGRQSLAISLGFKNRMKNILKNLIKSIGILVELHDDFKTIHQDDSLFNEVIDTIGETEIDIDMRAQCNYALLLYTTIKILEKIGLKDSYMAELTEHMYSVVLPFYFDLVGGHGSRTEECRDKDRKSEVNPMSKLIIDLVQKVIADPEKGKGFFNPSINARKCDCGKVFGFNVGKALAFAGQQGKEDAFRIYVRKASIGCNGVKLIIGQKQ
ncbi:uncharacterized protein LOC114542085 [Dendronephthya gigantea]|uniref:uncharacterized protein LOC114542085 n=1 Tax=Dendronephthya gigantea TaxID=151771 RepID=UPI00106C095D|nr:uncharacterized protein LOC114542085 [Dendronephthya gigantea]